MVTAPRASGTEFVNGLIENGESNPMGVKIYLLWFVPEGGQDDDEGILIGVYESEKAAKPAIGRLRSKPGFVDYPQGFEIHSRELNQDSWTKGLSVSE